MKTLVIYATKYGCTEKAAQILKSKLEGEVLLINVIKEKVPSLDEFDTIILGGSIYIGKIQKEILNYISKNLPLLLKKNIGLFICAGSPDISARVKELETVFPIELYKHAKCKELFGYEINYEKLGFLEKTIMKTIAGNKNSISDLSVEKINSFANIMCSK